jgi:hypothetical protein
VDYGGWTNRRTECCDAECNCTEGGGAKRGLACGSRAE